MCLKKCPLDKNPWIKNVKFAWKFFFPYSIDLSLFKPCPGPRQNHNWCLKFFEGKGIFINLDFENLKFFLLTRSTRLSNFKVCKPSCVHAHLFISWFKRGWAKLSLKIYMGIYGSGTFKNLRSRTTRKLFVKSICTCPCVVF